MILVTTFFQVSCSRPPAFPYRLKISRCVKSCVASAESYADLITVDRVNIYTALPSEWSMLFTYSDLWFFPLAFHHFQLDMLTHTHMPMYFIINTTILNFDLPVLFYGTVDFYDF